MQEKKRLENYTSGIWIVWSRFMSRKGICVGSMNKLPTTIYDGYAFDNNSGVIIPFDEKDVPDGDRHLIVKPAQYYLLLTNKDLLNSDYSASTGDLVAGRIETAAGIGIVKSNNVPQTNIASAIAGENNTYNGNK
jgi:hypothetical protein